MTRQPAFCEQRWQCTDWGISDVPFYLWRTPVPGGWLVAVTNPTRSAPIKAASLAFYPDPGHKWTGHYDPRIAGFDDAE
jgi:hypothetical protein